MRVLYRKFETGIRIEGQNIEEKSGSWKINERERFVKFPLIFTEKLSEKMLRAIVQCFSVYINKSSHRSKFID